jgi:RNA polymerase sigma factor (sigma-70 family)
MSDGAPQTARPAAPSAEKLELLARWSKLYRKPLLRFFQRRLPLGADREDLVQEVFVRIATHDDLSAISQPDSYLFRAAANVLTDWRRKQVTHAAGAHDELDGDLADVGLSPERVLIGRDTLRQLIASLKALPPRTRTMFMLYHFECLTHGEIARRMGVAVRTVEDHMARANAHVVKAIAER